MLSGSLNKTFPSYTIIIDRLAHQLLVCMVCLFVCFVLFLFLFLFLFCCRFFIQKNIPLHNSKITRKERNVLFNDALNTFYLRLHGVRHMVKDHSDSERGNPLPPHGLRFPSSSKGGAYHGLCYTCRGAPAGTRNISMGPP